MKKFAALFLAATLAAASIGPAHADWGRHRDYRPSGHFHHHHHHHREGHHRDGRNWIGPAAVLAITGLAIGAAAYRDSYAEPAPVVYAAPPPSGDVWYYCGSSAQYYPYTPACPEGWQAVPAR